MRVAGGKIDNKREWTYIDPDQLKKETVLPRQRALTRSVIMASPDVIPRLNHKGLGH